MTAKTKFNLIKLALTLIPIIAASWLIPPKIIFGVAFLIWANDISNLKYEDF